MAALLTLMFLSVWAVPAWALATNSVVVTNIPALTILEDCAATNVAFHIRAYGGVAGVQAATSSDTARIPNPTVAYTASTTDCTNGTLSFTPVGNTNGSVTMTLTVTNDFSTTNTITFTVDVTAVNDAPSFTLSTNNLQIVRTNGAYSGTSFLTGLTAGTNESAQTFAFTIKTNAPAGYFSTAPAIDASGNLTFEVTTNKYGTNTVTVVMKDNGGTTSGGKDAFTNTFTLSVAFLNYAPNVTGVSNTLHILENSGKTTNNFKAWDIDTAVTATVSSFNSNVVIGSIAAVGSSKTNFNLVLTTVTNGFGTGTVAVVVSDGTLKTTNNVTAEVEWVNQPPYPTAKLANLTILEDTSTNLTRFNVSDPDGSVSNITLTGFSANTNLVQSTNLVFAGLGTNRTLQIIPSTNANGTVAISVICTDTNSASTTNTFTLTLTPVNDPPSFNLSTNLVVVGMNAALTTQTLFATNMSVGPTNETQTYSFLVTPLNAAGFKTKPAISTNGTLTFLVATNTTGFYPVKVYLQDKGGTTGGGQDKSATNTFYIVVTNVPSGLQLSMPPTVTVAENKTTNVTITITDKDRENVTVTATSSTNKVIATLSGVGKTRTLSIRPVYPMVGTATIAVAADDGFATATTNLTVTVTAVNYPATVAGLADLTILEDCAATNVNLTVSDLNYDQTNMLITATAANTNLATFTVINTNFTNQILVITPLTNAFGSTKVTVVARDTNTVTVASTNTFVLTITPVNDAPWFALSTNALTLTENTNAKSAALKYTNFVSEISRGTTNESSQNVTFYVTTTNAAFFATAPTITIKGDLSFKTALYTTGSTTVTIYSKDSGGTNNAGTDTSTNGLLTLTVTNINQAATIARLLPLKLNEDCGTTNILVTLTDGDTDLAGVVITAACSKPELATVGVVTNGGKLYVTITPTTNTNSVTRVGATPLGTATIEVAADDGAIKSTNTFALTINAVNDAPSFTLGSDVTATKYLAAHVKSNQVSSVVVGPTTDETNQTWTAKVTVSVSDAKLFTKVPAIDKYGTLTYTPGTNSATVSVTVTVTDSGGTANGGQATSAAQTFNLVIPDNPFASVAGEYNGLFYPDAGVTFDKSGFVRLNVDGAGAYKGYVLLAGTSNQLSGQFAIDTGESQVTITNAHLTLNLTNDVTGAIAGTVTNTTASWISTLDALRSVYGTETIVTNVGDYTFSIGGTNAATVTGAAALRFNVDDNGIISLGGQLGDGTTVTQRVAMTKVAQWPLYVAAYGKGSNGFALSWVTFTDPAANNNNSIVSNNVAWIKTAAAGGTNYTSGFTNSCPPMVSPYNAWDGLWLTSGKVILSGGALATPITNAVTVSYDSVTVGTSETNSLQLAIDPGTGAVTGSFVDPTTGGTNKISGVVLQAVDEARGYFLGTNTTTGYFLLK